MCVLFKYIYALHCKSWLFESTLTFCRFFLFFVECLQMNQDRNFVEILNHFLTTKGRYNLSYTKQCIPLKTFQAPCNFYIYPSSLPLYPRSLILLNSLLPAPYLIPQTPSLLPSLKAAPHHHNKLGLKL